MQQEPYLKTCNVENLHKYHRVINVLRPQHLPPNITLDTETICMYTKSYEVFIQLYDDISVTNIKSLSNLDIENNLSRIKAVYIADDEKKIDINRPTKPTKQKEFTITERTQTIVNVVFTIIMSTLIGAGIYLNNVNLIFVFMFVAIIFTLFNVYANLVTTKKHSQS